MYVFRSGCVRSCGSTFQTRPCLNVCTECFRRQISWLWGPDRSAGGNVVQVKLEGEWGSRGGNIPSIKGMGSLTTHGVTPRGDRSKKFVVGFTNWKVGCWGTTTPEYFLLRAFPFKAGLGIFETNVRIQWNPVYKVFHRIHYCGNKTNCQL